MLYNAQGDKCEERRAITDNRAYPDENSSSVFEQSQAGESSSAGVPNENFKFQYQYDSYGNWVEQIINHRADEPLSVNRRRLTYY
jgi:hypothetical protein